MLSLGPPASESPRVEPNRAVNAAAENEAQNRRLRNGRKDGIAGARTRAGVRARIHRGPAERGLPNARGIFRIPRRFSPLLIAFRNRGARLIRGSRGARGRSRASVATARGSRPPWNPATFVFCRARGGQIDASAAAAPFQGQSRPIPG